MNNIERIEKMSIDELRAELHNLYRERREMSNNYSGWSNPDTHAQAINAQAIRAFAQTSKEINEINKRLNELGYFD